MLSHNHDKFERREILAIENGGQTLFGILHLPLNEGKVPAVVFAHGYGGNKLGPNRLYVAQAEELARNGVAALRFDFRGCGDSEGIFREMCLASFVSDLLLAIEHLRNHPKINGDQIGILGASLGGPVSVMAARECSVLQSLALWAPLGEGKLWRKDWSTRKPTKEEMSKLKLAGPKLVREFLSIEIMKELEHIGHVPLLHIHGDADNVVLPHHADLYRRAREGGTATSNFLTLPNSDHSLCNHLAERRRLLKATTRWFRETLGH
ncbi:MAG: alpha/beta hydrolase [Verrucomicrobia bacterium]|nr:alpha/beta hydrolase [Verrucomicrobiota bacterium]